MKIVVMRLVAPDSLPTISYQELDLLARRKIAGECLVSPRTRTCLRTGHRSG